MKRTNSFDGLPKEDGPIALTIGNFDGVHLGHQQILAEMKKHGHPYVVTFRVHPQEALGRRAPPFILSIEDRLKKLEQAGVERCYLIDFTPEFAKQGARDFLILLKEKLGFTALILGHDAKIGYKQEGDPTLLTLLSKELDFALVYVPPYYVNGRVVSSTYIRALLEHGDRAHAQLLLE